MITNGNASRSRLSTDLELLQARAKGKSLTVVELLGHRYSQSWIDVAIAHALIAGTAITSCENTAVRAFSPSTQKKPLVLIDPDVRTSAIKQLGHEQIYF